jgi:hypothetical protein
MAHFWFEHIFGAAEPAYIRGKPMVPHGPPEAVAAARESVACARNSSMIAGRLLFDLDTSDPENHRLMSKANRRWFNVGRLTTPTLKELRERVAHSGQRCARPLNPAQKKTLDLEVGGIYIVHEAVNDVLPLHAENPRATFQAASQMNCLEFPNQ